MLVYMSDRGNSRTNKNLNTPQSWWGGKPSFQMEIFPRCSIRNKI